MTLYTRDVAPPLSSAAASLRTVSEIPGHTSCLCATHATWNRSGLQQTRRKPVKPLPMRLVVLSTAFLSCLGDIVVPAYGPQRPPLLEWGAIANTVPRGLTPTE